jgi:hypothetical protein
MYLKNKSKAYRDKLDWDMFISEDQRDYYTVEHIYPQQPRKSCWTSKFSHYSSKQRASIRNSLGNLVPLSKPKNSSFQNKCFEEKKGNSHSSIGFRYGSYSENEVATYDDWTAKEILERGLKMLAFMERRWRIKLGDTQTKLKILGIEFVPKQEGSIRR